MPSQQMLLSGSADSAANYTSYDPANKGGNVTLSAGNLQTVTSGSGVAKTLKPVGIGEKKTWQVKVLSPTNAGFGIATSSYNTAFGVTSSGSAGVIGAGNFYNNGTNVLFFGAGLAINDVVRFEYDQGTAILDVYLNGTLKTSQSISNTYVYPCSGGQTANTGLLSNFGPISSFDYAPTAGYSGITNP